MVARMAAFAVGLTAEETGEPPEEATVVGLEVEMAEATVVE